jgi:Cu-Zn family superoxide dismutase
MTTRPIKSALLTLVAATMISACDNSQNQPTQPNTDSAPAPSPTTPGSPGGAPPAPAAPSPPPAAAQNTTPPAASQSTALTELPHAVAEMKSTSGSQVMGTISFLESPDNIAGARIVVQLTGLQPGPHGFHIHETGDCSAPDAASAGAHFNPHMMPHGSRTAPERHSGDLGNVVANDAGEVDVTIDDATVSFEGDDSVLGKAVIVHADQDDYTTQPSGNSGDRVACGVIMPTTAPPTGGQTPLQ